MKRLLTTLIILLVVIITGLAALVMLVNPNDFRAYMVKQVQKKSGYQLVLQDGMRWHVWPKLSIITGRMSLTAPGAAQPTVTAENMRLDVELWPLLSHQLAVKEVMLKGAILRVTPESQSQKKRIPLLHQQGVQPTLLRRVRVGSLISPELRSRIVCLFGSEMIMSS